MGAFENILRFLMGRRWHCWASSCAFSRGWLIICLLRRSTGGLGYLDLKSPSASLREKERMRRAILSSRALILILMCAKSKPSLAEHVSTAAESFLPKVASVNAKLLWDAATLQLRNYLVRRANSRNCQLPIHSSPPNRINLLPGRHSQASVL